MSLFRVYRKSVIGESFSMTDRTVGWNHFKSFGLSSLSAFFIMSHWANSFFLFQQPKQYPVELRVIPSHSWQWYSRFCNIFLFILPSIPQNKQVVKSLLSIFNLVRNHVAAQLFPQGTHNCTAECPTRTAHSTAQEIKLRIKENHLRIAGRIYSYSTVAWEYG